MTQHNFATVPSYQRQRLRSKEQQTLTLTPIGAPCPTVSMLSDSLTACACSQCPAVAHVHAGKAARTRRSTKVRATCTSSRLEHRLRTTTSSWRSGTQTWKTFIIWMALSRSWKPTALTIQNVYVPHDMDSGENGGVATHRHARAYTHRMALFACRSVAAGLAPLPVAVCVRETFMCSHTLPLCMPMAADGSKAGFNSDGFLKSSVQTTEASSCDLYVKLGGVPHPMPPGPPPCVSPCYSITLLPATSWTQKDPVQAARPIEHGAPWVARVTACAMR